MDANEWLYEESLEDVKELVSIMSLAELDEMVALGRGCFFAIDNDHMAKVHKIIAGERFNRLHQRG